MGSLSKQKLKTVYLLRLLETRTDAERGLTMPQILEALEEAGITAERKSVYRDLAALEACGYPITKLPTRPVQYALVRDELGYDDVMMLIDAVQSSRFLTERKSDSLVEGLKSLVSERQRQQLDKRVHVSGRIKSQSESVFRNVDIIHQAMQARRKVGFLYFGYGTDMRRRPRHEGRCYELTPVKVVFSNGNYYLAAYDDGDGQVKTYRIDRMELLQQSDAPATRCPEAANYGLGDFEYVSFGMFQGDPQTVTLRVRQPFMNAIADTFGASAQVARATPDEAEVRVPVQVSPQFFGWVAGLDGGVAIAAPARVARQYRDWLGSLMEKAQG